jgi:hypothetical protein
MTKSLSFSDFLMFSKGFPFEIIRNIALGPFIVLTMKIV